MKFARYLKDMQTPEWKRAYIDYRGLKKLITAIKKARESGEDFVPLQGVTESPRSSADTCRSNISISLDRPQERDEAGKYGSMSRRTPSSQRDHSLSIDATVERLGGATSRKTDNVEVSSASTISEASTQCVQAASSRPRAFRSKTDLSDIQQSPTGTSVRDVQPPIDADNPSPGGFLANLRRRTVTLAGQRNTIAESRIPLPLDVIVASLMPLERRFIDKLNDELDKVEAFYVAREKDAKAKALVLKEQLGELEEHRRIFHEAHATDISWKNVFAPRLVAERIQDNIPFKGSAISKSVSPRGTYPSSPTVPNALSPKPTSPILASRPPSPNNPMRRGPHPRFDPEEYQQAKKHLKKAILEHYRGLELLNNYRVLNLTGFRKALKKFEKNIKVNHIQHVYMQEKIEPSVISSGETVEKLVKDMETEFASHFAKGDLKKARGRLRATARTNTHHFSTFRSGIYIGVAIPALIEGIYKSFQPDVRERIPWDVLLYVYGILLIPVVFATLVGFNVWVWRQSRINYQFIFELDVRTQLDSREYFELPAFLLGTLIYAFWLSFSDVGVSNVSPTTWPLAWLVLALLVLLNPLPVLFPSSRRWLTRKTGKLLVSGTKPVEFTDFWLGDQFCSLIFTLSGLFFFGCVYHKGYDDAWDKCSASTHWGIPFLLSSLPLLVRAVQSVKRYVDSRLYTHLINGGKYCSSIIYYAFYYAWRHDGRRHDHWLGLFVFFATVASVYTTAWDLTMDWSFFKSNASHRFLRKDLMYSNNYWIYYFAIISNILVRFQWVAYIPVSNSSFQLTTFIVAMLEMLRRWQWNFFRLENEHLGNTDQYRVTREVPLPYRTEDKGDDDSDDDGDDEDARRSASSWRRTARSMQLHRMSSDERRRCGNP